MEGNRQIRQHLAYRLSLAKGRKDWGGGKQLGGNRENIKFLLAKGRKDWGGGKQFDDV